MKKSLILLFSIFVFMPYVYANDIETVKTLFNNYVSGANSYSSSIVGFYSPNAKIIRQVVKPDGQLVNATTNMKTYSYQMKISQNVAKARGYKNYYSNIVVTKVPNGVKVSALRQPAGENYHLKTYQIWQKQQNGNWVIIEELMQTKEQIFLRYADNK